MIRAYAATEAGGALEPFEYDPGELRSGQVEYLSQPGANIEEGTCLPCISRPKTDLVLDL